MMLDTMPMAAYRVMMDEPPWLIKGRVRPITGRTNRHIPTLNTTDRKSVV